MKRRSVLLPGFRKKGIRRAFFGDDETILYLILIVVVVNMLLTC